MPPRKIKKFFAAIYKLCRYIYTYRFETAAIVSKKNLWKKIKLTKDQELDIRSVYGSRIDSRWHRLYQSYTGIFNKDYFPEILFSTKLEPMFCPRNVCRVLQDKSLVEILYASVPGLKFPKTVVVNCSGIYYDTNRNIVNKEMAVSYAEYWCRKADFIIKPTKDTKEGQNVIKFIRDPEQSDRDRITELFDRYKKDFIVQECVINHDALRALYEGSLNTLRIMTYILDDMLYHTRLILRISRNGSVTDDELYVGVSDEGYLRKEAFTFEGERYLAHPDTKVIFESYYIPNISKLIDYAYECHKKTPHNRFISWDFTLDKNANPVLIEANMLGHSSWFPQVVCGESTFGDNTKRMLELIGIR
jgi:hypothetical protein